MGWRHKKMGAAGAEEFWPPSVPVAKTKEDIKTLSLTGGRPHKELALPPLTRVRLSCRQLGSFRGKKIYEAGLRLLQLH